MDPAAKPNPARFAVYTMLPDGKGFTIKGCKYVFKLDRYGGWRDEHGNYYNANGEPDFEPEDAELTPSEGSLHSGDDADDYDEYEPTYDDHEEEEEHFSSWEIRNMERVSRNMQTLSSYPSEKPLRVYFSDMPFKAPPKSVYEAYSQKVPGIINIIFDLEQNRRNGKGHFIIQDSKKAEALVKLEGERVLERDVHFQVEKLHQLIMDPIKQSDMVPFWNPKASFNALKKDQKKDDIPRFKAAPAEEKKEQKKPEPKVAAEQKQTPKTEAKKEHKYESKEAVKVQKKEQKQEPEFTNYLLNFQIFESKTRFFNWFAQQNGNKDTDIKGINKEQKDAKTKIFIQLRTSLAKKINGKLYNGKEFKLTAV